MWLCDVVYVGRMWFGYICIFVGCVGSTFVLMGGGRSYRVDSEYGVGSRVFVRCSE